MNGMYKKLLWPLLAILVLSVSACSKEESLEEVPAPINQDNQFRFVEGGTEYKGVVDTAFLETVGTAQVLTIEGTATQGSEGGVLALLVAGEPIGTGTYPSPLSAMFFLENGFFKYESDPSGTAFTVRITQFSATSVAGTFSGTVKQNGVDKTITEGSFTATID